MARIEMPAPEQLSAEQAAACAEVIQGKRGKIPVPMIGWLHNPELARRLQKLGELLRFETSLEAALTELAILVCARRWTSHVEWKAHKALALDAGVDARIVDAIAARIVPDFNGDERDDRHERARTVHAFTSELLDAGRVSDVMYEHALAHFGKRGVMELIAIAGYYTLVSFTLNTFELGLPENAMAELDDPQFPATAPAN